MLLVSSGVETRFWWTFTLTGFEDAVANPCPYTECRFEVDRKRERAFLLNGKKLDRLKSVSFDFFLNNQRTIKCANKKVSL